MLLSAIQEETIQTTGTPQDPLLRTNAQVATQATISGTSMVPMVGVRAIRGQSVVYDDISEYPLEPDLDSGGGSGAPVQKKGKHRREPWQQQRSNTARRSIALQTGKSTQESGSFKDGLEAITNNKR